MHTAIQFHLKAYKKSLQLGSDEILKLLDNRLFNLKDFNAYHLPTHLQILRERREVQRS